MDNYDKIQYLRKYQVIDLRIKYLQARLYGISGISYGEKIGGGTPRSIIDDIDDIDRLKEKRNELILLIHSPVDLTQRMLLDYIYIQGLSIQYVADHSLIPYSYRQLRRIHQDAIDRLNIK